MDLGSLLVMFNRSADCSPDPNCSCGALIARFEFKTMGSDLPIWIFFPPAHSDLQTLWIDSLNGHL